ncbi:MAG: acetylglutamate kinase [Parasporobacterium sp.]|nr:acetylglutamate kinase [Parasporobacterium sp.]
MQGKFSNADRAQVLTQALPYIQKHRGKIVVIKYGGNAMINEQLKEQVMEDIVLLNLIGVQVVLVHGGGPEMNDLMNRLGKKPEFIDGLRVTDKETIDIAQMVLAGKINKSLVSLLGSKGGTAIGLSGIDGHILQAKIKDEKLGYVGEITGVNIEPIKDILERGYIPVVSTIAGDSEGNVYNINGDTAAAHIAGALEAERLIMVTDIQGVLRDKDDETTLIPELTVKEAKKLYDEGIISGGMIPKVDCCIHALNLGVRKVIIMDGRVPHSILMELLTDEGAGTMFLEDNKDPWD